jgi:hypothetical protein
MPTAVRLDTLRSLDVHIDLCHAWFLQGCKQLQSLTLFTPSIKGVSNIAQLTGLTQFGLHSASNNSQQFSAEEQSELGSALAALSNLQCLSISHAPPGPVTQALSQLSGLAELTLAQQDLVATPGPLTLPSCVKLTLDFRIRVQHLASVAAPYLQHLDVTVTVKPSDLDALREPCTGVLRACCSLSFDLHAWSKEDTVALMAVLSQGWQPSAEALQLQPIRSASVNSGSSCQPPRQWCLRLLNTHCSRQCLALLPKGLSSPNMWWVLWLTQTQL